MKNSNLSTMISALPGDAQAGAPLYAQVKQAVLDALSHGEWKQGEAIPPEKQLAERFGVSIGTLRKAIDELSSENILVRQQGRGTYVAIHNRNHHFFKFFRVVGQDGVKTYPVTTLLKFRRLRATGALRDALQLDTGDQVFEFSNRLVLNGDVVMVDTITVPEPRFKGLTEQMLRERPSTLYNFYQDAFNINVIATDERLRACSADDIHAAWLDVSPGAPLLEVRRLAYSYNREPVEWRVSRVNTDKYEYLGQAPGTPPGS